MDKKLTALLTLLVLLFSFFMSWVLFNSQIKTFTRASEESIASPNKSLIFIWPLTAKADGQEKVTINIFVRNEKNQPLSNKLVSIYTNIGKIEQNNQTTDKSGKATFIISSNETGIAKIEAVVDNQIKLNQSATIKFE